MDMIESLRREIEKFKQDVSERYQEIRVTSSRLGVRQKRVEEGNTETKSKLNMFEEFMRGMDTRITVQGENLTALAEEMGDFMEHWTGELPRSDVRTRKKKGRVK